MISKARLILALLLSIYLTGCANTELISDQDPNVDLSQIKSFHVVRFENDNRGIEKIIAHKLNGMGFDATHGPTKRPPKPTQAIIEYSDKWMWDITMYMLELKIDLRDPDTNYKFATGRSYRTSLARKKPEEMVEEVLNEIFNKKRD